jgi:H/ACA ribonucleoprotein complex subunit 3
MGKLKKCERCGLYTMKEQCPNCGERTQSAHPPKFSPQDKYGKYRRMARFGGVV